MAPPCDNANARSPGDYRQAGACLDGLRCSGLTALPVGPAGLKKPFALTVAFKSGSGVARVETVGLQATGAEAVRRREVARDSSSDDDLTEAIVKDFTRRMRAKPRTRLVLRQNEHDRHLLKQAPKDCCLWSCGSGFAIARERARNAISPGDGAGRAGLVPIIVANGHKDR